MRIEIDSKEVLKNMGAAKEHIMAELAKAVAQGALIVEGDAKRLAPVQSSDLRRSITHKITVDGSEIKAEVGTNLYYAPYVELGTGIFAANGKGRKTGWAYTNEKGETIWTRGSRPQPFLYPALSQNRERVKLRIQAYMRGVMG